MTERDASLWTLQEFATVAGQPWYALQKQDDAGILSQWTGYRHEVDVIAARLAITPEELPAVSEDEFFARLNNDL